MAGSNDSVSYTPSCLAPVKGIEGAQTLAALVEFDNRERRQTTQLGHEDFPKIREIRFSNPRAIAL